MAKITDLHKKWLQDDDYRAAYAALENEFAPESVIAKDLCDEIQTDCVGED